MSEYQPFKVHELLNQLFLFRDHPEIDCIAKNQYFIFSNTKNKNTHLICLIKNELYQVNKTQIQMIKNEYLNKHGLSMGQIASFDKLVKIKKSPENSLANFMQDVIKSHGQYLNGFLSVLYDFLRTRRSDKGFVIYHDHIQLLIGEIVSRLKWVDSIRENNFFTLLAQQELKAAGYSLAKLGGGRSFLQGNIIEIILIFDLIYNIYF